MLLHSFKFCLIPFTNILQLPAYCIFLLDSYIKYFIFFISYFLFYFMCMHVCAAYEHEYGVSKGLDQIIKPLELVADACELP